MNVLRSSSARVRALVDALFAEVAPLITVSSKARQKEALKNVLLNLLRADRRDCPVRYSRDKNRYQRDRRYGMLFFKYDRLIPIIDALEQQGYIEQSSYYNDPNDDRGGLQTRMWGTDRLWMRCREQGLTQAYTPVPDLPADDEEVIVLRNEAKQGIGYMETRETRRMRADLERYNAFIRKHLIEARLTAETLVDNRWLIENLLGDTRAGLAWIKSVQLNDRHPKYRYETPIPNFTKHKVPLGRNPYRILQDTRDRIPASIPPSITHTNRGKALLRVALRRFWSGAHFFEKNLEKRAHGLRGLTKDDRKMVLAEEFPLRDLGVDELVLVLDQERLYRVFNRSSFDLGGRAYGALHQGMLRKAMRRDIFIDGQPTIEIDFSAYHIVMLYHLADIDYQEDPYLVCEGPEMRATYKAVGLIAINAQERDACGAIRDELKSRGLPLPAREEPLKGLVRRFREAHPAIAHRLFSDVGVTLMNIDSKIMDAILVRLMDHGVLGLSVYDSVIVQQQHEAFAKEVMREEYEWEMGFKPRF